MGGQQEQEDWGQRPEPAGELADVHLEQAAGGLSVEEIKPSSRPLVVTTSNIDAT